jgi:hypothetical protein
MQLQDIWGRVMAWKHSLPHKQEALKQWRLVLIAIGLYMCPLAVESAIYTTNSLRLHAAADFAVCGYPNHSRFDTKLDGHDLGVHPPTINRHPQTGAVASISGHLVHIYNNWVDDQVYYVIPFKDGMMQKPEITIDERGIGDLIDLLPLEIIDSAKFKIKVLGTEVEIGLKPDKLPEAAAEIQNFFVGHGWQGQAAAIVTQIGLTASIPNYCSQFHGTGWLSEVNAPGFCGGDEGAMGFACSEDYCDEVQLTCAHVQAGAQLDYSTTKWSHYFSEEGAPTKDRYLCDGIVTGIDCDKKHCDSLSLECTRPAAGWTLTDCQWSDDRGAAWLSEEHGGTYNFMGKWITGVECDGDYCDKKRFHVCSLEKDPNVKEFEKPTIDGYRLDYCREWGTNCGTPAADAFCTSKGYTRSVYWEIDQHIGVETPTKIFATGDICNQSFCDGFKVIDCQ